MAARIAAARHSGSSADASGDSLCCATSDADQRGRHGLRHRPAGRRRVGGEAGRIAFGDQPNRATSRRPRACAATRDRVRRTRGRARSAASARRCRPAAWPVPAGWMADRGEAAARPATRRATASASVQPGPGPEVRFAFGEAGEDRRRAMMVGIDRRVYQFQQRMHAGHDVDVDHGRGRAARHVRRNTAPSPHSRSRSARAGQHMARVADRGGDERRRVGSAS